MNDGPEITLLVTLPGYSKTLGGKLKRWPRGKWLKRSEVIKAFRGILVRRDELASSSSKETK